MKRCPNCRRDYYDDTLLYCLDDGSALLDGPTSQIVDEPATAIFPHRGELPTDRLSDPDGLTLTLSGVPANSIAVLPFKHLSSAPDDEYFCDGLAEDLLNALTKIDGLKVIARASAFSFKGTNISLSEIGRTLGVKTIVEGSVRKSGDRLRVTVQMVNADDGYQIWSERYDREMDDIFAIQDEITLAVVDAFKERLLAAASPSEMEELLEELKHHSHEVEAYQLYLRGRYLFNKFNEQDLYRARECYEEALAIEPKFAQAYAGIADVYMWLTELGPISPREGMPKAKEAALKAIALDPELSEAHTSLAIVSQEFDYDFRMAELEYKQAIELSAGNALAHQMYGALLAQLGRFDEAERQFQTSLSLDPLSPMGSWIYPFGLFLARRYDDCIDRARKILELDGSFAAAYLVLSFAYQMKGDTSAAADNYIRFLEIFGLTEVASKARAGFVGNGWEGFLHAMTAEDVRPGVTSYISAVYFAALGEKDAAIECLKDSFEKREGHMVMLNVDPRFDSISSDRRFKRLVAAVGFPS
jgi:TolB-like protein/Tfp pilus assembly protein PilF